MDEKDLQIKALETELTETLNAKLALRQQLLYYEEILRSLQEDNDEGEANDED